VSETNSEYIDIELNITGLLHNKVLDFRAAVTSCKMYFIGRANLSKEVKRLETAMPHLSVSMSKPFLEVAQNGDKATSIKILAEKHSSKRNHCCGNANDLAMMNMQD
jgi:hypothetical protein